MLPYYEKRPTEYYAFEWRGPYSWQLHLHQQLELLYVENGTVLVTIDYQTQRLHTGDLAVIFPNCVHSYQVPEDAEPTNRLFGMVIVPQLAGDFCEPLTQYVPQAPIITADRLGQEATYAVRRLFEQRDAFRPIIAKSYLQLLLAYIWSELSPIQDKNVLMMFPIGLSTTLWSIIASRCWPNRSQRNWASPSPTWHAFSLNACIRDLTNTLTNYAFRWRRICCAPPIDPLPILC